MYKSRTGLFMDLWSIVRFLNNFVKVYPINLKLGMLDHMNNTFRDTVFSISVDVPLNQEFFGMIKFGNFLSKISC